MERIRSRRGGVLVLMRKAPDEFRIRNYPFECGSKGGKSKTVTLRGALPESADSERQHRTCPHLSHPPAKYLYPIQYLFMMFEMSLF